MAVYALAAALWLASLMFRLAVTPDAAARLVDFGSVDPAYSAAERWAGGLFAAVTVLAGGSLVALGVAIALGGSLASPVGWFAVLVGTVVVVGYLAVGDMPPFVSYLPTGLLGLALLLTPG